MEKSTDLITFCGLTITISNLTKSVRRPYLLLILIAASAIFIVHTNTKPPLSDLASSIYFVAPNGNDLNTGSDSSPFKTIGKAISIVQTGDTIRIKPGIYKEHIVIDGKSGNSGAPIRIIGESANTNNYPVIDGGDPAFTGGANPAIKIINSSWWNFERIKIINSTEDSIYLENSHYITVRRNILDFHKYALRLKNKSSHILVEYNEFFQSFPSTSTWSQLKGSKWEGGAFTSFGGAGMNIIRHNYFHNLVNGVVLYSGGRIGNYYDANIWIYRNRFENVIDDPYEPESYAFNNHFFNNTLINTHRIVSLAPGGSDILLGPIYIYNNMQIVTTDITKEANIGRANSAFKADLSGNYYRNGVFIFNNSIDVSAAGINGYGVDLLNSTVTNLTHLNNAYKTEKQTILKSTINLVNSVFDYDMSQTNLGYNEPHGFPNTDPQFKDIGNEDLRLNSSSPARGKSTAVSHAFGFSSQLSISQGSDLGAFQSDQSDFRSSPIPKYEIPPAGEDPSFPTNVNFPPDIEGGQNPPSGPKWSNISPAKPGDANRDNIVDGIDYVIWLNHYNSASIGPAFGDFDTNGTVDGIDYVIWLSNYGK